MTILLFILQKYHVTIYITSSTAKNMEETTAQTTTIFLYYTRNSTLLPAANISNRTNERPDSSGDGGFTLGYQMLAIGCIIFSIVIFTAALNNYLNCKHETETLVRIKIEY